MSPADPGNEASFPKALNPTLAQCGDKVTYVWIPFTVVDVAPYVAKILGEKPVAVMDYFSGASALNTLEDFNNDGFPLDQFISAGGTDLDTSILHAIPSLVNGEYFSTERSSTGLRRLLDVQEFLQQTAGLPDNTTQNVESGWLLRRSSLTWASRSGGKVDCEHDGALPGYGQRSPTSRCRSRTPTPERLDIRISIRETPRCYRSTTERLRLSRRDP